MSIVPIAADGYIYDVQLDRIDRESGSLVFKVNGIELTEQTSSLSHWTVGHVGRLRSDARTSGFAFHVYLEQRLRRDPQSDDPQRQQWGWRLGEQLLRVRAGIIPGLNGEVVPSDTERLEIDIPREFIDFCARRGLTPVRVLRAYIADLCELFNWVRRPREDGYSSNGSDERTCAQMYFHRTFD